MIYKTQKLAPPADIDYMIEMHKSLYCDELLNYSTRDMLSGGILCESVDETDIPQPQAELIKNHLYNAHPFTRSDFSKFACKGFVYLQNNEDGKMQIAHYEPTDKELNEKI